MRNQCSQIIGRPAEWGCLFACFALAVAIMTSSDALAQDSSAESSTSQETEKHNMDRVAIEGHGEQADDEQHGDEADDHAPSSGGSHAGDDHEADFGQQQAARIAVREPPSWYAGVIWGSGLLFVLAATLGSVAIVMKGPEPPDPADAHGHGHGDDDHGHH